MQWHVNEEVCYNFMRYLMSILGYSDNSNRKCCNNPQKIMTRDNVSACMSKSVLSLKLMEREGRRHVKQVREFERQKEKGVRHLVITRSEVRTAEMRKCKKENKGWRSQRFLQS